MLLLLLSFFLSLSFLPVEADAQQLVHADSLDTPRYDFIPFFWLRSDWQSKPGDLPHDAIIDLDPTEWAHVHLASYRDRYVFPELDPKTGIGWLRTTFRVAPDLAGEELALLVSGAGAFEVFLDGNPVFAGGYIDDDGRDDRTALIVDSIPAIVPFQPRGSDVHTLTVRYSGRWFARHTHLDYHRGIAVGVQRLGRASELRQIAARDRTNHQTFLVVSALAFALVHSLIFLFYPRVHGNLYYALLTLSVAGASYLPIQIYGFADSLQEMYLLDLAWKGALILAIISGVRFLSTAFTEHPPFLTRLVQWAAVLSIPGIPFMPITAYYVLVLVSFIEMGRLVVIGLLHHRSGAWIVALGFGFLIGGSGHAMLLELGVISVLVPYSHLYANLGLLAGMAVYLARSFAATSRDLEEQIAEVEALNTRRIAQERGLAEQESLAREEENRRRLLETDNALKTRELEESRKRQAILEALERSTRALERTEGQLLQSEKLAALGNLVAGIAHEINTPVGAINSMHDTLVRAVDALRGEISQYPTLSEEPRVEAALDALGHTNGVIASGTERVTRIARSLRTFARLDDAEMLQVDIHAGIDATLPLIEHYLKGRIEVVRDYGNVPEITCSPSRLNQVFLNLLINAAQAIEQTGTITIRTRAQVGRITVEIVDDGSGIAAEHLDQIFDPGFTTRGVGVGTGLGLSICYQIVNDHHGTIYVNSTEGEGTTVTVELPITPAGPDSRQEGAP